MDIFKIFYWSGLVLQIVIRAPYQKTWKNTEKTDQRVSPTEKILLGLLTVAGIILPLIYSVTNWLDFADYSLPTWMGWLGVFFLACNLFIFARAHQDLKSNWSPSVQIFEGHHLVTNGIYSAIRHPMYASGFSHRDRANPAFTKLACRSHLFDCFHPFLPPARASRRKDDAGYIRRPISRVQR